MRKRITAEYLKSLHACPGEMETWRKLFPEGMELTRENVLTCHKAGLDVTSVAKKLMTPKQRREFLQFTLRRQPHSDSLVSLQRKAGLVPKALRVEGLRFGSLGDLGGDIIRVSGAARAAASAAWDVARSSIGVARDIVYMAIQRFWDARAAAYIAAKWDLDAQIDWCCGTLEIRGKTERRTK